MSILSELAKRPVTEITRPVTVLLEYDPETLPASDWDLVFVSDDRLTALKRKAEKIRMTKKVQSIERLDITETPEFRVIFCEAAVKNWSNMTRHNVARISDIFVDRFDSIDMLPATLEFSPEHRDMLAEYMATDIFQRLAVGALNRSGYVQHMIELQKKESKPESGSSSADSLPEPAAGVPEQKIA